MGTAGSFVAPAGPVADFWRSEPGDVLPDATTDTTDLILHRGLTGIGAGLPAAVAPVATLDVAGAARSGVDGRVAGVTPFYVTGNLPGIGVVVSPPATPVGGVEFRHSNQTQGMGLAFDGLYATGSNANQDVSFVNRGTGQFLVHQQALLGGSNFWNWVGPAIAAGQGWQQRWYAAGVQQAGHILRRSAVGVGGTAGMEDFWQRLDAAGVFRNALMLSPSVTNAGAFSLTIDQNVVNDAKLVLFGFQSTGFYGLGVKAGTLAYFIAGATGAQFHRWYGGVSPGTLLFSVNGTGDVAVDPGNLNPGGWASPVLRFGTENASGSGITSQRAGAGPNLNGLSFFTSALNRMTVKTNGIINMTNVPTFATDALAGAGGLVVGDLYKTPLGLGLIANLCIKL